MEKTKNVKTIRTSILIACLAAMLGLAVAFERARFNAKNKMHDLTSTAKHVWTIVRLWEHDDASRTLTTTIGQCDPDAPADSLEYYMAANSIETGWFAVVCDETGELQYTLYSLSEITEDELWNQPDKDEIYSTLSNPFTAKDAISICPAPGGG